MYLYFEVWNGDIFVFGTPDEAEANESAKAHGWKVRKKKKIPRAYYSNEPEKWPRGLRR